MTFDIHMFICMYDCFLKNRMKDKIIFIFVKIILSFHGGEDF